MVKDPREVLGVPENATTAEIKRAYRKLARRHHPDLNPDDPQAEARFKEIAAAYEALTSPTPPRRKPPPAAGQRWAPPPFVMADPAYTAAVQAAVARLDALFIEEILPRYIARDRLGRGCYLVHRLLHDLERLALFEILDRADPGERARETARAMRAACPVQVNALMVLDLWDKPVAARLVQSLVWWQGNLEWSSRIELFAGSLQFAGHGAADLDQPVLRAIGRETVRWMEGHLPEALRPLHALEAERLGRPTRRLSVAQAWRQDLLYVAVRVAAVATVLLLVAALLAIIVPGFAF